MLRSKRVIVVVVGVFLIDAVAFVVRSIKVDGIPVSYLLVPIVALVGTAVLALTWSAGQQKVNLPPLPEGHSVKGAADDPKVMLFVIETLLQAAAAQELRQAALQDSIDRFVRYFNDVDRKNQAVQLRLTVVSICVGLIGGYLPLIFTMAPLGK